MWTISHVRHQCLCAAGREEEMRAHSHRRWRNSDSGPSATETGLLHSTPQLRAKQTSFTVPYNSVQSPRYETTWKEKEIRGAEDRWSAMRIYGVTTKRGWGSNKAVGVKNKTKESLVLQHVRSSFRSGHSWQPAVLFEQDGSYLNKAACVTYSEWEHAITVYLFDVNSHCSDTGLWFLTIC